VREQPLAFDIEELDRHPAIDELEVVLDAERVRKPHPRAILASRLRKHAVPQFVRHLSVYSKDCLHAPVHFRMRMPLDVRRRIVLL
jgi:hypothetical protein